MRNIVNHGPRFAALLLLLPPLLFIASLLWNIVPAPAQSQTYEYVGPPWDIPTCESITGQTAPPCSNGSVTASVTFKGVASGYSGTVPSSKIASYALNANGGGIGSLSDISLLNTTGSTFTLSSGQITAWTLEAQTGTTGPFIQIETQGNGGSDFGNRVERPSGTTTGYGVVFISPPVIGI